MQKITEYQIVTERVPNDLVKKVNELIKEGWQPTGGIFIIQSPLQKKELDYIAVETYTSQAMVKLG